MGESVVDDSQNLQDATATSQPPWARLPYELVNSWERRTFRHYSFIRSSEPTGNTGYVQLGFPQLVDQPRAADKVRSPTSHWISWPCAVGSSRLHLQVKVKLRRGAPNNRGHGHLGDVILAMRPVGRAASSF